MPPLSSAAGKLSHFRRGASDPRIAPRQRVRIEDGGNDGFRVRHVSRISAARRDQRRAGVRDLVRTGRCGRALGSRRDVAGRNSHRAGALGAVGAVDPGQCDRRPHQADEDRHRGPGPAAMPSAASCRGSRDGRSDQPWTPDFRRRPQRLSADLRGLWRAVRREPRPLRRDPRNPETGLDRAALLVPGQVLQLRERRA